ncbi:hypothetical protein LEP1GSC192_2757 [Leptospira sp. B5-022]|nr:hypothetical protein LEP1GSC192_2757 [Leptospira sp. B5-022]
MDSFRGKMMGSWWREFFVSKGNIHNSKQEIPIRGKGLLK